MPLQSGNAYEWINEGISHYNAKRYKECLGACERAIQLDPDCARAYHGKGLALTQQKRYEEALIAYQKASHLAPENAKIHANMAELFYCIGDYEKSGLSYKRAIQLDSQFKAVYIEKSKKLLDEAFESLAYYLRTLVMLEWAISAFRKVLLFNPDDAIALSEIGKIQKGMEVLKSCPICYKGTLLLINERAKTASINLCSDQSDEEVRLFLLKGVKDSKYFSRTADGWEISFTFPLPETDFRVEVLRNEEIIAYGYYWIKDGYIGRVAEYNIHLTIPYRPAVQSREAHSINNDRNSTIYVSGRRRVRRGS